MSFLWRREREGDLTTAFISILRHFNTSVYRRHSIVSHHLAIIPVDDRPIEQKVRHEHLPTVLP